MSLSQPPQKPQRPALSIIALTAAIALPVFGLLAWAAVEGSAPPTVKIGLVAPFEGEFRNTGYDVLFAVKLALQERNQGEGLAGYRVELVALNDFNDPATAAEQARALVADPDVVGVVGHLTPAATQAALPVYRAANLAVVAPWSVDEAAFQPDGGLVSVAATTGETEEFLQNFIRTRGLMAPVTVTGKNIAGALPDSADALVLNVDAVSAGQILGQLSPQGLDLPLFGLAEAGNRQLPQVAGPAAEGLIYISPGPAAADLPAATDFATRYQNLAGVPPSPRAVMAYDAAQILLDSVEKTIQMNRKWYNNFLDRRVVRAAVLSIKRSGISGPVTFDAQGHRHNAPVWFYQITQGAYPGTSLVP